MSKICPRYAQDMTTDKTVLTKRLPDKTSKPVRLKKMSHKSVLTKRLPDKTSKAVLTKCLPDKTSADRILREAIIVDMFDSAVIECQVFCINPMLQH